MQPITEYAYGDSKERKEILAGNENLPEQTSLEQTSLIEPDEAALQQWTINNQDPEFLKLWDQKYIRPEQTQPTVLDSPQKIEDIKQEAELLSSKYPEGEPNKKDYRKTPAGMRDYNKAKGEYDRLVSLQERINQNEAQGVVPYLESTLSRYDENSEFNLKGEKIRGAKMRNAHKDEIKQMREQLEQLLAQSE